MAAARFLGLALANPDGTFAKMGLLSNESVEWLTARQVGSAVCDLPRCVAGKMASPVCSLISERMNLGLYRPSSVSSAQFVVLRNT
jgi:hypothetical protein